jgi:hypothetical protein
MPADPTTQNALLIIAGALVVQTVLMICTVVAMAIALKRAHKMIDSQLGNFTARLDDVASQTRVAVDALQRSAARVDTVLLDVGNVVKTVTTAVGAPRAWLTAGAASVASAFARWRRSRREPFAASAR